MKNRGSFVSGALRNNRSNCSDPDITRMWGHTSATSLHSSPLLSRMEFVPLIVRPHNIPEEVEGARFRFVPVIGSKEF